MDSDINFDDDDDLPEEEHEEVNKNPKLGRKAGSTSEIEERRRKVFFKLMEGKKLNQIALEMGVSIHTIQSDKTYIESAAYDAVKSQVGKKAIYVSMTALHIADWVAVKAKEIAEGKRTVKKLIRTTNMETGEPMMQEIDVYPSIADINTSLKVMLDAGKTKADIALNNYVFIAESEALKKLESDVLKIDLDYDDVSEEPAGFVIPNEIEQKTDIPEETTNTDNEQPQNGS
jgi:hypothetical protein